MHQGLMILCVQLHVFPEGRISYNGKIADLRWGVGKMVCDVMLHSGGKYVRSTFSYLALYHMHFDCV
jgi:hypothetical protein